jgi:hypothetical protein
MLTWWDRREVRGVPDSIRQVAEDLELLASLVGVIEAELEIPSSGLVVLRKDTLKSYERRLQKAFYFLSLVVQMHLLRVGNAPNIVGSCLTYHQLPSCELTVLRRLYNAYFWASRPVT